MVEQGDTAAHLCDIVVTIQQHVLGLEVAVQHLMREPIVLVEKAVTATETILCAASLAPPLSLSHQTASGRLANVRAA